jgi:hypothetical protein
MPELVVCILLVFVAGAAAAQSAHPDPSVASVRTPKPVYDSAFAGYRGWVDPERARWREANDEVGRLSGHAGHVKPARKAPAAKERK